MRTPRMIASFALLAGLAIAAPPARAGSYLCFGDVATIVGTPGHDNLEGTAAADVIVGLGDRDVIRGKGGRDRLCGEDGDNDGGGGRDRIYGGGGSDRIHGEHGPDLLDGQAGGDKIHSGLGGGDSWPNELIGGRGDDRLIGYDAGDLFWPGQGDDFAVGRGDASIISDTLYFSKAKRGVTVNMTTHTVTGQGQDEIFGIDDVYGSWYRDTLIGDEDRNNLNGECADAYDYCGQDPRRGMGDLIKGKGGGDSLDGGAGPDRIFGGAGKDFAWGGFGTDTCRAEDRNDCEH